MSYEVVARRWRPVSFKDVVGQEHVTATLANAIESDRVAHAFVFAGIRGVGKTTVARVLARALNCPNRQGAEPCNDCPTCKDALAGSSVDILEIDGASHTGVDNVRDLIEGAQYRPAGGLYRVYIIDEVHRLSAQAFDALLKLIEEPPAHVKFVLATTESHKLPQTILSRCQRYDFRRLSRDEISKQLRGIADKDKLGVDDDAIGLIAREADGSMRDAQSLLEQVVAACSGDVTEEDVTRVLGIAGSALVVECVTAILESDAAAMVEVCSRVREGGFGAERYLSAVLEMMRHVAVGEAAGVDALGKMQGESVAQLVGPILGKRSQLDLQRFFDVLLSTAEKLRASGMADLVLEMGLIKAASLESVDSAADIIAALRAGAGQTSGPGGGSRGGASPAERRARSGGGQAASAAPAAQAAPAASPSPSPPAALAAQAAPAPQPKPEPSDPRGDDPGPSDADQGPPMRSGGARRRPQAPPEPAPAPRHEVAPMREDESRGGQWESFLGEVRKACGFDLYVALSNCDVVTMDGKVLEMRPTVGSFRRKIEAPEAMRRLQEVAKAYFGGEVDIRMLEGTAAPAGDAPTSSAPSSSDDGSQTEALSVRKLENERKAKLEQDAVEDPSVQAALSVLGGRIDRISQVDE